MASLCPMAMPWPLAWLVIAILATATQLQSSCVALDVLVYWPSAPAITTCLCLSHATIDNADTPSFVVSQA